LINRIYHLKERYSNTKLKKKDDFTDTTTSWSGLACGMYSNKDLEKWGDALLYSTLLTDASRKKLFNFLSVNNTDAYGLCVSQKQINGKEAIVLSGNVPGYNSAVYLLDNKIVAVLCNLSDYSGNNLSYADTIAIELLLNLHE
jgi:hypothetical protein